MLRKSREGLIRMVRQLAEARLTEEEEDRLLEELRASVPHPRVSDLIFHADPPLTAEEVVDRALAHRPIEL